MKLKITILSSVTVVTLVLAAFFAGKVSAATGCFTDTNGHWAETFICWMKDNGITSGTAPGIYSPEANVTRAQMAVFMQKLDELAVAQAKDYTDTSFSTGTFYFNAGPSQWQKHFFSSTTGIIELYTIRARLRSSAAGVRQEYFVLNPSIPAAIYGRQTYLDGVKICYDANETLGTLKSVELAHYANGAAPTLFNNVIDSVSRSDQTCRIYSMASGSAVYGSDVIFLLVNIGTTGISDYVDIFNVSFITHTVASVGILSVDTDGSRDPMPGISPSLLEGLQGNP